MIAPPPDRRSAGPSLLRGAAILGAAALGSKLLGTMQKIPLQNLGGDEVFGLYNAVYQVYIFVLTLLTAGIPIATSKLVSERAASGRAGEIRTLLQGGVLLCIPVGAICFAGFYFGAGGLATLIGIRSTEPAFRAIAPAFGFVPLLALLRGYGQGLQTMTPTALSQVAEQLVRVVTMLVLTLLLLREAAGHAAISAGAAFGSVTGAAAGFLVILAIFAGPGLRRPEARDANGRRMPSRLRMARELAVSALPIGIGLLALPLFTLVDTLSVPRMLQAAGYGEQAAVQAFGLYNHGIPLVQLVAMLAGSVSAAIVPYVAEARVKRDHARIAVYTELAIRFTWLIGLAAAIGLALTAHPVNVMLYKSAEGGDTIAILAFTAWFSTLVAVAASLLQGLGHAVLPVIFMLAATLLKLVGNALLVPAWGIDGAAWSAVAAFGLAALLSAAALSRLTGVRFPFASWAVRPLAAVLVMGLAVELLLAGGGHLVPASWPERLRDTAISLVAVGGGAVVYAWAAVRFGCIGEREFRLLPESGDKLLRGLRKLRLIGEAKGDKRQ